MKRFLDAYLVARASKQLLASLLEYVAEDQARRTHTAAQRARLARAQEVLDLADRGPRPKPVVVEMTALARQMARATDRSLS